MKRLPLALALFLSACASPPPPPPPPPPASYYLSAAELESARNAQILAGKGLAGARLGMTRDALLERFGPGDRAFTDKEGRSHYEYWGCGFTAVMRDDVVVVLGAFLRPTWSRHSAYTGATELGLSRQSTIQDVLDEHGAPEDTYQGEGGWVSLHYGSLGIVFRIEGRAHLVHAIEVLAPAPSPEDELLTFLPKRRLPARLDPHAEPIEPGVGAAGVRVGDPLRAATRALGTPKVVWSRARAEGRADTIGYARFGVRVMARAGKIDEIHLFKQSDYLAYEAHRAPLPFGLSWSASRRQIEWKLGPPDLEGPSSINERETTLLLYLKLGLSFAVERASGRLVYALVHEAQPDWAPAHERERTLEAEGARVVLPAGALGPGAAPKLVSERLEGDSGDRGLRLHPRAYRLEGAPGLLRKAARVTLPLAGLSLPTGVSARDVVVLLGSGQRWERLRGATLDEGQQTISVTTRRLVPLIDVRGGEPGRDARFALAFPLEQPLLLGRAPGFEFWAARGDEAAARERLRALKGSLGRLRERLGPGLAPTTYVHLQRLTLADGSPDEGVAGAASGGDTVTLNLSTETTFVTLAHELFHLVQQRYKLASLASHQGEVSEAALYRGTWLDESTAEYMGYALLPPEERATKALGARVEEFAFRGLFRVDELADVAFPHQYQAFLFFCFLELHYDVPALIRACYARFLSQPEGEASERWDEAHVLRSVLAATPDREGRRRDLRRLWSEFLLQLHWKKGFEPIASLAEDVGLGPPGRLSVPARRLEVVPFPGGTPQRRWTLTRTPPYSLAKALELRASAEPEREGEGDLTLRLRGGEGAILLVFPHEGGRYGEPRVGREVTLEAWHERDKALVWVLETSPAGSARLELSADFAGEAAPNAEPPPAPSAEGELLLALAVPPQPSGAPWPTGPSHPSPPPPQAWRWEPGQSPRRYDLYPAEGPRVWGAQASSRGQLLVATGTREAIELRLVHPTRDVPLTRAPVRLRLRPIHLADFGSPRDLYGLQGLRWGGAGTQVSFSHAQHAFVYDAQLAQAYRFPALGGPIAGPAVGTLLRSGSSNQPLLLGELPAQPGSHEAGGLRWRRSAIALGACSMLQIGPEGRRLAEVDNEGDAHVEIGSLTGLKRIGTFKNRTDFRYEAGRAARTATYEHTNAAPIGWAQDGSAYYFAVERTRNVAYQRRRSGPGQSGVLGQGRRAGVDYPDQGRRRYSVVSSHLYRWTPAGGLKRLHDLDVSVRAPSGVSAVLVSADQRYLAVWGHSNARQREPQDHSTYSAARAALGLFVIDVRSGRSQRLLDSGSKRDYASFVKR